MYLFHLLESLQRPSDHYLWAQLLSGVPPFFLGASKECLPLPCLHVFLLREILAPEPPDL